MNDNRIIKTENVYKAIKKQGYFYILAEKYYGEGYIGPKYIIATDDKDFESTHPKFEGMIILDVSKFIELVEVINNYACNEMREKKRRERYHNDEGYYEEISEVDDDRLAPLAVKDHPQDPVEDEIERLADKERLLNAMNSLNELQRKRLYDYYFKGLTYRQIAAEEHVGYKNIRESVESAIKKIKKYL